MKLEKYQQGMVMIIQLVVYWIMHISKIITDYLIAVDLSKQKALDADPRAIQQRVFQGVGGGEIIQTRLYTIIEQSKETMLEFSKGTANVL